MLKLLLVALFFVGLLAFEYAVESKSWWGRFWTRGVLWCLFIYVLLAGSPKAVALKEREAEQATTAEATV